MGLWSEPPVNPKSGFALNEGMSFRFVDMSQFEANGLRQLTSPYIPIWRNLNGLEILQPLLAFGLGPPTLRAERPLFLCPACNQIFVKVVAFGFKTLTISSASETRSFSCFTCSRLISSSSWNVENALVNLPNSTIFVVVHWVSALHCIEFHAQITRTYSTAICWKDES